MRQLSATALASSPAVPAEPTSKAAEPETRQEPPPRRHRGRDPVTSRPILGCNASRRPAFSDGMLKLMLILLAFFIFLHSRSELSAERAAPILDSLALRFASSVEAGGETAARARARQLDPRTHIRRRLLGHLPITAGEVEVAGALLAFDLHEAALFAAESEEIVRDRLVFIHRLAQALSEHPAGRQSLLVVTTRWPDETTPLTSARFSRLAEIFGDTQLELHRLRLGVAKLPEGIWRFAIRAVDGHAA